MITKSACTGGSSCVTVSARTGEDRIFINDKVFNDFPMVTDRKSFKDFITAAKAGEFDEFLD